MSRVLNLFRSLLFFALFGYGFQSVSDDGSFALPVQAIENHRLTTAPISSPFSAKFITAYADTKKMKTEFKRANVLHAMFDPAESLKKKETLVARSEKNKIPFNFENRKASPAQLSSSSLCEAVKTNRDLDFRTPTSYLSSVLIKAGAVDSSTPLFTDHADEMWESFLSKNNFADVSAKLDDGRFKFENLRNGTLIVLEKSCLKEGTAAVYCDGKYYATKFVETSALAKKVNSGSSNCQLGHGMRIVIEKSMSSSGNSKTVASRF